MAIDTSAKRASCIGLALLCLRTGIAPTGTSLSAAERLHVQGLYSGIAASAPSTLVSLHIGSFESAGPSASVTSTGPRRSGFTSSGPSAGDLEST